MGDVLYALEDVGFAYPGARSRFKLEIDALSVRAGEVLALVGPNGAGKTTLLALLAFLLRPGRGRLEFRGCDPWATDDGAATARRDAVLLSHHPYLFKGTVGDNIRFGLKLRRVPGVESAERTRAALSLVGLEGWSGRGIAGLSAGQVQRVALARALALRPRVLLFDEPTANIDAGLRPRLEAVLREAIREWGAAVVFSTHDFSQASRLADGILYLSEGRRVEFSHENCFSGTASTDGRMSWIEPGAGLRIVFPGAAEGHVTCVIDPSDIRIVTRGAGISFPPGPNVFAGRVTRMETMDAAKALVRITGDLVFRAAVPVGDLEAGSISLYRDVLLTFEPGSVEVIGGRVKDADKTL